MNCKGCHWLMGKDNWCDMNHTRLDENIEDTARCKHYDDNPRRFDTEYFYALSKKFVDMYNTFKNNTKYMKEEGEVFNHGEAELLSFALNDMKRELEFYKNYNLYDDLNE